jgi:dTDP-glucose 4,6-dehydratase
MKIAVTGGAGFVGANLVAEALSRGHEVVVLDHCDRYDRLAAMGLNGETNKIEVDLRQEEWGLPADIDVLVHLAAMAHVDYSRYNPKQVIENNVLATANAVAWAVKLGVPILFTSSVEVYGGSDGEVLYEDAPLRPLSAYAASKVAGEAILSAARASARLCGGVLRFTNLYGPWQAPDRVVPRIATRLLMNCEAEAEEGPIRDFVHVADAVRAVLAVAERDQWGEIQNVASGRGSSLPDVGKLIKDVAAPDGTLQVIAVRDERNRGACLVSSPTRLRRALGWTDEVPLDIGIAETTQWYADHREWWLTFADSIRSSRASPDFILDSLYPHVHA